MYKESLATWWDVKWENLSHIDEDEIVRESNVGMDPFAELKHEESSSSSNENCSLEDD